VDICIVDREDEMTGVEDENGQCLKPDDHEDGVEADPQHG